MPSEPQYALNGELHVAYRAVGDGPLDFLFVSNWFTNVETLPELPSIRPWLEKMAKLGRVIFFDQPGTGLSDPVSAESLPTLEQWTDSITAVLDAIGSDHAVLLGIDGAFATCALFAATHPARTSSLIVLEGFAYAGEGADRISHLTEPEFIETFQGLWGTGELQHLMNPDMPWNEEIRASWARQERLATSRHAVAQFVPLVGQIDVRGVLPSIRVPTLVLHHIDDALITLERGRQIAEMIPGAQLVELPGRNLYLFVEPGWRRAFEEISEFLTGTRTAVEEDRQLATVLFTDIVGSTRKASDMGDNEWRALLDAHDRAIRAQLRQFRGREIKTTGDGFLVSFDGPARAIRCAQAINESITRLGIDLRMGLHTGECEVRGADLGGLAVHIAARIGALATAREILVSSTLKDLVIGSGIEFTDRGAHDLKGVPGAWSLFSVTR